MEQRNSEKNQKVLVLLMINAFLLVDFNSRADIITRHNLIRLDFFCYIQHRFHGIMGQSSKIHGYYYIGVRLYTFSFLAVLFQLPSIFSALLEDSLFWSYFPRFRVSVQRPRGLFDDAFFLAVLFPLPSICAAPSRTLGGLFILDVLSPLSRVPAQLVQISMI